jgi:hypothetical protein
MNNAEKTADDATKSNYLSLLSTINEMERRMGWADLICLSLNILTILFTFSFISFLMHRTNSSPAAIEVLSVLFCLVIGMALCVYWTASAIRLQLKLKLRYFQARFLERKMDRVGEYIFSDEENFFAPGIRHLESPDKKELLHYPASGITRMDGFVGRLKPRHFSWLMPLLFFGIYWVIFIWIIIAALR